MSARRAYKGYVAGDRLLHSISRLVLSYTRASSSARIALQVATHSLQMNTPLGPAINRRTSALPLPQKVRCGIESQAPVPASVSAGRID